MKNIIFLNLGTLDINKEIFYEKVAKKLKSSNLNLIEVSTSPRYKKNFTNIKIDLNLKSKLEKNSFKIFSKIGIKKKNFLDWKKVFNIYYNNEKHNESFDRINYLVKFFFNIFINKKPLGAVVWTKYHPICEIFIKICNFFEVPYLISERGLLNGTIMLEEKGIYGESYLTNIKKINHKKLIHYKSYIKKYNSLIEGWPNSSLTSENLSKKKFKVVFLGTNEIWHGFFMKKNKKTSPFFSNHLQPIKLFAKSLKKYPEIEFIFKPHPKDRIFNLYKKNIPKVITIKENVDIKNLIRSSDLVVSICSSTILDAIILNKPVFCLGRFELSNKKFFYDYNSKKDIDKIFNLLIKKKLKIDKEKYKYFFDYLLNKYLYNVTSKKFHSLNHSDYAKKIMKIKSKNFKIKNFDLNYDKFFKNNKSYKYTFKNLLSKFFEFV